MFIGHQDLVRDFKSLIKNNRLAHGYIFFGEPEVGKFYFAKHLANLLENGEFKSVFRPLQDSLILQDSSGIDAMREIKSFLWKKPAVSLKRVVVINNAENLTPQAQNAILKITEEPPENSVLILIASRPENLLPPLLSRLQKIYFGRLSDNEMLKVLAAQAGTSDKKIVDLAWGRPGRAFRLLNDDLTNEAEKKAREFLLRQPADGAERSKFIKKLVEEQKERPALLDLFFESLILNLQKDKLKNWRTLKSVLNRFFLIKRYNTNKRIQLEAIQ